MRYRQIAWLRLSALVIAFLILCTTGVAGVLNLLNEWAGARTVMQKSVTAAGGIYGILGLTAAVRLMERKTSSVRFAIAWAAVATYTGAAAVAVYGNPPNPLTATLGALGGGVIVTSIVVWLTAVASRQIVLTDAE